MFVIKHAVAKALKVGVGYLRLKLLTHAFVFFLFLSAAGAITACVLQALFYRFYDFNVGVKCDFQSVTFSLRAIILSPLPISLQIK